MKVPRLLLLLIIFQVNVACSTTKSLSKTFNETKVSSITIPGHSHNDYEGENPLLEALSLGLRSIEVDIYLINNELYVSHFRPLSLISDRTLEKMYLEPLARLKFYQDPLLLLIDVKTDATRTFSKLTSVLEKYSDLNVKFIISGNRDYDAVLADSSHLMALDGRPSDIGLGFSSKHMPLISQHYNKFFSTKQIMNIKSAEISAFREFLDSAHDEGKLVRLWASPDHQEMWKFLLDLGVDLVNTDKPNEFADWYFSNEYEKS